MIIFAYLEIQYMVVPFEGLGVGILWAMLVIYARLLWMAIYFRKMYASMFIIATINICYGTFGCIMGALYNVHFYRITEQLLRKVSAGYFHTDNNMGCCGNACRILRRYSYGGILRTRLIMGGYDNVWLLPMKCR